MVQVPTDYAAEPGGQVEYDINALRLTLPTAAHPNRPQSLALSAAIPTTAPERLSHVFSTVRSSPWARTEAGQKFLTQLARLPQPISGTFALPRVEVSGPLKTLKAQADLNAGNLVLGDTKVGGLTARLGYQMGLHPSGHVTASATNVLVAGASIGEATADADFQGRTVTVHSLRATSARAFLTASGTANLDGDIDANVDASNIPLALLGTALPAAAPYLRVLPARNQRPVGHCLRPDPRPQSGRLSQPGKPGQRRAGRTGCAGLCAGPNPHRGHYTGGGDAGRAARADGKRSRGVQEWASGGDAVWKPAGSAGRFDEAGCRRPDGGGSG